MFMLSRILISFVTLVTLIGSNIADWNSPTSSASCGRRMRTFMGPGSSSL
jgi:hypothetical protein